MKKSLFLTVTIVVVAFSSGFAQKTTYQGPKIKMDVAARVSVLGEDDNYIYFCAVDRNGSNQDDEMFITVYDKRNHTVVRDHEIDEDYEFSTAYLRGADVVLLGSHYNKKTKCVDFFQYAFPIMAEKKGKIVRTTVYSVPAEGKVKSFSFILQSPDGQKIAYVTYLKPSKRKEERYTADVHVFGKDGTDIKHINATWEGTCPFDGRGYLANDGTVFMEERVITGRNTKYGFMSMTFSSDVAYRYVTFTDNLEYKPMSATESLSDLYNPFATLLPDNRLFVFGATDDGVGTFILDSDGEVVQTKRHLLEKPSVPQNVKYEGSYGEKNMTFKPHQILLLQDGRILVLAHQYLYVLVSNGRTLSAFHDHRNLYMYLFDSQLELLGSAVRPYASVNESTNHEDVPVALEWRGQPWLIFNGHLVNYRRAPSDEWKVTASRKAADRCLVMGALDEQLHFEPKIVRHPTGNPAFSYGEYFDQLLKVSGDTIYYINQRDRDNFIEEIR